MTKVLSPRINYHIGNKLIVALASYVDYVCNESKDPCEFADVACVWMCPLFSLFRKLSIKLNSGAATKAVGLLNTL